MLGPQGKSKGFWIAVLAAAVALSPAVLRAEEPVKTDLAISWIPEDAAFYVSLLRCREQIEIIRHSKAIEKLTNLPAVVEGIEELKRQSEDSESPAGKVKTAFANPQVQNALKALGDMLGQETFLYSDPNLIKLLVLSQKLNAVQYQSIAAAAEGKDQQEVQRQQTAAMLHVLAQNLDLIAIPNSMAGFKVTDKQQAKQNVDVVAGLAAMLAMFVPELAGHTERKTIGDSEFVTLSLDGKMIPWDQVPLDEIRQHEVEKGDLDKVIDKVKELKLVIAVGLRGDYLLLAKVESTDMLARLGSGKPLADRPEFKPLASQLGKRLTSISYLSNDLVSRMSTTPRDLDDAKTMLRKLVADLKLPTDEQEQINKDAASLAEDLKPMLPKPGAKLGFSYLTDAGCESFGYDWGVYPQLDATKPLSLTAHLGGDPLLAFVQRDRGAAEGYAFLAKLFVMGHRYFDKYAVPRMKPEDKEKYEKLAKGATPLVKRFDTTTRKLFLPAVADGQGALLLDAKLTSRQPTREMRKLKQPIPLPEPALVWGVSDAKRLVKAGSAYREIANDFAAVLHDVDPDAIPTFTIPSPNAKKIDGGTLYSFPLPEDAGLDKQIVPTIGVSDAAAAITASQAHAKRLLAATPLKAGDVLADAARPRAAAGVFRWAALLDAATPWIDEAIHEAQKNQDKSSGKKDKDVIGQVHAVLEMLKAVRVTTLETYQEGEALVTHAVTEIHDVE